MAAPLPSLSPFSNPNVTTNCPRRDPNHTPKPHTLIPKCKTLGEIKQIQAYDIKTHDENDIFVRSKLVDICSMICTNSSMGHARLMFDRIPQPDIILFNFMARGYARTDTPLQAVVLFVRILELSIVPDSYTFPSLLKACARAKALEEGKQLHCAAIKHGLVHDIYVCPALMNMYIECNDMGMADRIFGRISEPCVVAYNAIIIGYARASQPNKALSLFRELQTKNLKPTDVTMLSVISSCALLGALDMGKWIHEYVKVNDFDQYVKVNTGLVDMYAKCGSLDDAVSVFESMNFIDTQAWSAMIMAYGIHGLGDRAISTFAEMRKAKVHPDGITLLGLLYACNHAGLVEEGCEFYNSMTEEYGIVPGIKHYGCMVDLLGRAGRLDDAYEFIKRLPIRPTPLLWRTLLSACSNHGNVEMGKKVIDRISGLDKSHSGDYVIFSNLCARAGKWEDVCKVRNLMKERGVKKVPGCSSVEVDSEVHEFFSGDGTCAEYRELHLAVDRLIEELKSIGYVPNTSQVFYVDMEDDEKEAALRYHSEKLAITFALLNTNPGTTIRVVKNLRVCKDCHSAAKLISFVSGRQIILRDVSRFHHFNGGSCSCGDYW